MVLEVIDNLKNDILEIHKDLVPFAYLSKGDIVITTGGLCGFVKRKEVDFLSKRFRVYVEFAVDKVHDIPHGGSKSDV